MNQRKVSPVWGILIFVILTLFCIGYGISGLTGEKVTLDEAFTSGLDGGEIVSGIPPYGSNHYNLRIENRVNFIPMGSDYYFMILSEDEERALIVRAPKDFGDNFDGEYKNFSNKSIRGKVKKSNSKVENNFRLDNPMAMNKFQTSMYIDMTSTRLSIMWLAVGIFNILMTVVLIMRMKKSQYDDYVATGKKVGLAAFLIIGVIAATVVLIYLFMRI